MVSMKVSLLTSYCLIEANSRLRNRVVHLKSLFIQSARLNIYLSQNNQLTYQNNEFHFELIWFFLCNELRSDTDCAMRLGKLMNWRQCDRVFIGGLGLRLFNCDRLSVSPPASPLPDRAVHTRAQSTYFPSSFFIFSVLFYFFPSLVLSFFTHAKKLHALSKIRSRRLVLVSIVHYSLFR